MENKLLLSILIPTYNGASKYLVDTLDSIIRGVNQCEEGLIEVIVSNNASTDNTLELLANYDVYPYIKYYTNEENIGFARNIVRLTDEYAKGKFAWVIGDDDLIYPDAMKYIVEEIKKDVVDYLSVGFKLIENKNSVNVDNRYYINYSSYSEAIEQGKPGNILGTFMSSAIVRLSLFKSIPKKEITSAFDTFQSIFPNAYVNATAFYDKRCAYITDEVILTFIHRRDWGSMDNMYMIRLYTVPALYDYLLSLGIKKSELENSYKRILHDGIYIGFVKLLQRQKIDTRFFRVLIESVKYPSVHLALLKTFLVKIKRLLFRKIK